MISGHYQPEKLIPEYDAKVPENHTTTDRLRPCEQIWGWQKPSMFVLTERLSIIVSKLLIIEAVKKGLLSIAAL